MAFVRRRWPWLILILFPLLPLWRTAFLGEAIGPFDQIRQMAPWSGPAPGRPFDVLQADAVLQFYPWRDMVFEAWSQGQMPLWNPFQLAGTPLLANSQSAGFYPPHILLGVLHVPTHWAMALLAWFHLAWAGLGTMALARRLGASETGAGLGGLLFSGSAFLIAWTALPSVVSTVAWIPWALTAVYGLFGNRASPEDRSSAETWRSAAGLAACVGMMLLAGHLQFAFYGLLAVVVVALMRFVGGLADRSEKSHRTFVPALLCLLAIGLGAGLAAPQLLPVLEHSQFSHRRNVPTEEGYQAYVAGAIAPFELVGLVFPTAVGRPDRFAPGAEPLSQYWPALVKQGSNFAEGAIGIGPLAFFGLLLFPWRRAPMRLWAPVAALGVLALLLALGTVLNKPLYLWVPGWSSTGSPGRIGVLFVLAACVLAGVGLDAFLRREPDQKSILRAGVAIPVAAVLTLLAASQVAGSFEPRFPGMDPGIVGRLGAVAASGIGLALALALAGAGVAWTARRGREEAPHLAGGVLAALLMWPMASLWTHLIPSGEPLPNSGIEATNGERIAAINDPWELVVAAPATLPPNTASILRLHDLAGYDSLLHRDTHLFLGYVNGQDPAPPANGNIQYVKPTAPPEKLAEAGVSRVYSRKPLGPTPAVSGPGGLLVYDLLGGERAFVASPDADGRKAAAAIEDGYDRQTVRAQGPGLLTVRDRLMPGWRAFLDGRELPLVNRSPWQAPDGRKVQLWRQVELPDGEHSVEFRYDPPGMRTGWALFAPSVLLTGALAALAWRERRRRQ
jgi:hypothetical protein